MDSNESVRSEIKEKMENKIEEAFNFIFKVQAISAAVYENDYWKCVPYESPGGSEKPVVKKTECIDYTLTGAGLQNIGNSCFMNAILQCMIHTVPFFLEIISKNNSLQCICPNKFCLPSALKELCKAAISGIGCYSPIALAENLEDVATGFQLGRQEDCHEYLLSLWTKLKACDNALEDKMITRVFGGIHVNCFECLSCERVSRMGDESLGVELSITDCHDLDMALETHTLSRVDQYRCESCEKEGATHHIKLEKVPNIAMFHLKRFENNITKIKDHVQFPLLLDLAPFAVRTDVPLNYELYAIVVHEGDTLHEGHYYSFIRISPNEWYKYDDSKVSVVDEVEVLNQRAYILFYAKKGTAWFKDVRLAKQGDDAAQKTEADEDSSWTGADEDKRRALPGLKMPAFKKLTGSESRFDRIPISPLSKGIKDAGYERTTMVQGATLPIILKGTDVLSKARTGTRKTVDVLGHAVKIIVTLPNVDDEKISPMRMFIICPTREFSTQAAAKANKLFACLSSVGVPVVIGGTRLAMEQIKMQANACEILMATPRKLRHHEEILSEFATQLMGVNVLVVGEADHFLYMEFLKEIEKIIAFVVPKQRERLLFSSTIPQEVPQICDVALKRDYECISTQEEGSEYTHALVRQTHLVAPLDKHFLLLYTILRGHIADDANYKVLVFCTTAKMTKLVCELLNKLDMNVRKIHSQKSQSHRMRVWDEFSKSSGLILVTSDVPEFGVDYPDVTFIVQIGVPEDRQQYIHRFGRTERNGKEWEGLLLLAPWEELFLNIIKDLPISKATEPVIDPDTTNRVECALGQVKMKRKQSAYQAWLRYYNSNKIVGQDKCQLVELANEFSRSMGLDNPPAISKLVLEKMGLKKIPGLKSKKSFNLSSCIS